MPRHARPAELALKDKTDAEKAAIPPGPNSSPMALQGVDLSSFGGGFEHDGDMLPSSLPPLPQSPPLSDDSPPENGRTSSNTLLSNLKSRMSPERGPTKETKESRMERGAKDELRPNTSSMSKVYHFKNTPGSTPELSLVGSAESVHKLSAEEAESIPVAESRPQPSPYHSADGTTITKRKDKTFRNPLARSKSNRRDSHSKPKLSKPDQNNPQEQIPPKTAPLQSDWPGSEARMFGRNGKDKSRGKSAERAPLNQSEESMARTQAKDPKSGFKASSAISKAGNVFKGLAKIGRSSSHSDRERERGREREVADGEYIIKVIHLPLVEQTRITRISRRLSDCRDKTEYWMPSLPWRCIDYLNSKCDNEGLYRIPGSGPQVKLWQRRFDSELDVNLLNEKNLFDPNEIASMLKAWLRGLPTEIFPMSIQQSLAAELEKENPDYKNAGQEAPIRLKRVLSDLPPFNYYLLFAVTCHLSLLLAHKDKNRMDLNNLAVCVMPCLGLERWLFNYLVGDWRNCWDGCYTEKEALAIECAVERGEEVPQPAASMTDAVSECAIDDRALSNASSDNDKANSKPSSSHDDSRATKAPQRDPTLSPTRKDENGKPQTYTPTGAASKMFSNRTIGLAIEDPNTQRPSTADGKNTTHETSTDTADGGAISARVGHNRSQSDLPVSPVSPITHTGEGFNFQLTPTN